MNYTTLEVEIEDYDSGSWVDEEPMLVPCDIGCTALPTIAGLIHPLWQNLPH